MFIGINISYKWDFRIGLGDYVQVFNHQQILTERAISLMPTYSRLLKPIVRTQCFTYTPLVSFINKLFSLEEKNIHIGQDPVSTRGDPDIEENVISGDEDEPLGIPENIEGADRTPTRVQPMPEDVQGEYLNKAFSTPYINSKPQNDSEDIDEDTDVCEPEEKV